MSAATESDRKLAAKYRHAFASTLTMNERDKHESLLAEEFARQRASIVEQLRAMADTWAQMCPAGDWGSGGIENAIIADAGREILQKLRTLQ